MQIHVQIADYRAGQGGTAAMKHHNISGKQGKQVAAWRLIRAAIQRS